MTPEAAREAAVAAEVAAAARARAGDTPGAPGLLGRVAALWGVLGAVLLLAQAVWRLAPRAGEALGSGLSGAQWALLGVYLVFMAYSEGYRAFQKQFAPRVVVRAAHLARHPRPLHVLIAPLYCMGLVHARRRRLIISWTVILGIVGLVLLVHRLPQPWRGMIDAGVVLGLSWGIAALLALGALALAGRPPDVSPELP